LAGSFGEEVPAKRVKQMFTSGQSSQRDSTEGTVEEMLAPEWKKAG